LAREIILYMRNIYELILSIDFCNANIEFVE